MHQLHMSLKCQGPRALACREEQHNASKALSVQLHEAEKQAAAALEKQHATLQAEMLKHARQIEDQAADHIKSVTDDMMGAQAAVSASKQELQSLQVKCVAAISNSCENFSLFFSSLSLLLQSVLTAFCDHHHLLLSGLLRQRRTSKNRIRLLRRPTPSCKF
jgi:hypothetical protein